MIKVQLLQGVQGQSAEELSSFARTGHSYFFSFLSSHLREEEQQVFKFFITINSFFSSIDFFYLVYTDHSSW